MTNPARPRACAEQVHIAPVDDGIVIFDPARGHYHALDEMATRIWRMADGTRTTAQIGRGCGLPSDAVEATIATMVELDLVQATTPGIDRRALLARLSAAAVAIPVIASISAPAEASVLSGCGAPGDACPNGCCYSPFECCGGICAATMSDSSHCGGCNIACPPIENGTSSCIGGMCFTTCDVGFVDCFGSCLQLGTMTDCSFCGDACVEPPTNGSGFCAGGCGIVCDAGYAQCAEIQCLDITSDPDHCGESCVVCASPAFGSGEAVCNDGQCGVSCSDGYAECSPGQCVDVLSDPDHCGELCHPCYAAPSGTGRAICTGGVCGVECYFGTYECTSGDCVDIDRDASHCGTDCKVCPDPADGNGIGICRFANCAIQCDGGYMECEAGSCHDVRDDDQNCGQCGWVCPVNERCLEGHCS